MLCDVRTICIGFTAYCLQVEPGYERQMVAEAALVFGPEIGATGMYTAVFLVFLQQKW